MLEPETQPGKFSALKNVAAPYKTAIKEQKSSNNDDNGMEEADMAFLRKIDLNSFIAYLIGFILFNSSYWVEMVYGWLYNFCHSFYFADHKTKDI